MSDTAHPETETIVAVVESQADGQSVAHARDLTGAFATGPSPEVALANLAAALPAYFTWLRGHDEYTPVVNATPQPSVAEREAVATASPCAGAATFAADREPLSDEDLDWYLPVLGWALEDLGRQPAAPDAYSHVALALDSVLAALQLAPTTPFGSGPQPALDAHAQLLRALPPDQRAREVHFSGATWTPRKALRWGITHARAHTAS